MTALLCAGNTYSTDHHGHWGRDAAAIRRPCPCVHTNRAECDQCEKTLEETDSPDYIVVTEWMVSLHFEKNVRSQDG